MIRRALALAALIIALGVPAYAQSSVGIRAGVSADPDQFFFGGHIESKPLIRHLTFRPNVEVGVGDGLTLIAFNLEFVYHVDVRGRPWWVYLGGGPAAIIATHHGGRDDGADAGGGFNILVGIQHRRGLFAELKVGAIDSPDLKFTVGYVFR